MLRQERWSSRIEANLKVQLGRVSDWQDARRELDQKAEELRRRENNVRQRENRLIKCVSPRKGRKGDGACGSLMRKVWLIRGGGGARPWSVSDPGRAG